MLDEIVEFAGRVDRLAVGLGLSLGLGLLAGLGLLDNGSGRGCGLGGELRLEVGDGRVLSLDVGILGFESVNFSLKVRHKFQFKSAPP